MYNMWVLVLWLLTVFTNAYQGLAFLSGGPVVRYSGPHSTQKKGHDRAPELCSLSQDPGAETASLRAVTSIPPSPSPNRLASSVLYMKQDIGEPPSRRWTGTQELPRLLHSAYLENLKMSVFLEPTDEVLLVFGRKSVGKTRTMLKAIEDWRAEGRLVVEVDLKGVRIKADDFPELLWREYFQKLQRQDGVKKLGKGKGSVKGAALRIVDEMYDKATMYSLASRRVYGLRWKGKSTAGLKTDVKRAINQGVPAVIAAELAAMARAVDDIIGWCSKGETTCRALLDHLKSVGCEEGGMPPVLVIREVEKLVRPEDGQEAAAGKAVFKTLFRILEKWQDGTSVVPVIVESTALLSDDLYDHIHSSPNAFTPEEVPLWPKEEARRELVRDAELLDDGKRIEFFTEDEFEKLWDVVGGHAGQLFNVHSSLILGNTLEEALDAKMRDTAKWLRCVLRSPRGRDYAAFLNMPGADRHDAEFAAEDCRERVLDKLRGSPLQFLRWDVRDSQEALSLDYLLESYVLWYDEDSGTIVPMHRAYEQVIKGWREIDRRRRKRERKATTGGKET